MTFVDWRLSAGRVLHRVIATPVSEHLDVFRTVFKEAEVVPFRVLAVLNVFARSRTFLEKCDHLLLKLIPPVRRFGDMAVMIGRKASG